MSSFVDRLFTPPADHDPLGVRRKGLGVSGSNGLDLGHVVAMLQDVLVAQEDMRQQMREMRHQMQQTQQQTQQQFQHVRQEFRVEMGALRQDVAAYHHSVVGHGILISELDARVRRIETHLALPPAA